MYIYIYMYISADPLLAVERVGINHRTRASRFSLLSSLFSLLSSLFSRLSALFSRIK